jgi:iron complex outermembrane receptor protein
MKKCLVLLWAILLCLSMGMAPIAIAEDEDTEEDEFTLEEITVTAQKREENQQKVAIAMEVISGEDLTAMGKNDIDEILKDIASIEISSASTGTRINIRGLVDDGGSMNDLELQAPMVAVNVDGAYSNMHNAGNGLFDIERVEVLMGPQSTMYGNNSPGGIVNVITAAPKTDKYSGNLSVEYGSFDLLNLQGALNVPVIQDTLALRVSANNSKQGTWVEGDPDSESTAVRLKALWNVYEDLEFSVTGNWSERSSGGMTGGRVKPFVNQDDDYYADGTPLTDPWTPSSETSAIADRDDQITQGLSADIAWSLPFGNLSIVPSYSKSEADGWHTREYNDGTTEDYYQVRENEQKGGEARVTSPADFDLFQWVLGGTYFKSYQYSITDYEGTASDRGMDITQEKSALYANIVYPVWFHDPLRLTVGYRQSWDENNSYEYGGMSGTQGDPDTYSKPDLKYGFEYDAADNMMFYGNYSSSYRSSNAVAIVQGDGTYPPNEELDATPSASRVVGSTIVCR